MAVDVRWVPYGQAAAEALRGALAAAKAGDALAPATVVVPSNYVGVATRRLLASGALGPVAGTGPGLVGVTFATVYRLAELLGAPRLAAEGRRPVSTPVVAAAVRAELATRPSVFDPVAEHPATEDALVATLRELTDVPSGALDHLAGASHRARDVVDLHGRVRARLAPGWYDEADLLAAATAAVGDGDAAERLGTVVVHLPQRLGRGQAELLRAIAARSRVVVLAGTTGDAAADATVRQTVAQLAGGQASWASSAPHAWPPELSIVSASDADDEVRTARRLVTAALDAGTPLERIAVLYASPEPYARLVHEHLAAADVPRNGAAVRAVGERLAGRTLLGLLRLVERGARRTDVMQLLADGRFLDGRGRPVPAARWDRLARAAYVVAGREQWDGRLASHAADQQRVAELVARGPGADTDLADRRRREADDSLALRAFVLELLERLVPDPAPDSWSGLASWAGALVERYLGGAEARASWPAAERAAANRVEAALARLAALDGVERTPALDVFVRTLELELDSDLGRTGRFGEGVLVGTIGTGVGVDTDLVVVLGMAEGTFPTHPRDDSLLPDRERRRVDPHLPLRRDAVGDRHRQLLATLAGTRRAVLCWPRGDLRRSAERTPSRWLLDAVAHLEHRSTRPGGDELAHLGPRPWRHDAPSFAGALVRTPVPATAQELRIRHLAGTQLAGTPVGTPQPAAVASHPIVGTDPVLAAGMELVRARASRRFTRFDGNLAALQLEPIDRQVLAPTRLEAWAACPHRFLLQHVLGVRLPETPDDELELTPLEKGSVVHRVVEDLVASVLDEVDAGTWSGWTDAHRARLHQLAARQLDRLERGGRAGRELFWRRDRARLMATFDRFLDEDQHRMVGRGLRPVSAELAFGPRGGTEPVTHVLPDGRVVRFAGSADRVDETASGDLVVLDYKTGKATRYKGLSGDDPVQGGRRLQLVVYALAARAVLSRPTAAVEVAYWFITDAGGFEPIGYRVDDDVIATFDRVVATIADGIEGGVFPAHPEPSTRPGWAACDYCDPDRLGVSDQERAWERKRGDPVLAGYVGLVEPDADGADGAGGSGGG